MSLAAKTVTQIRQLLKEQKVSVPEVVADQIKRIEEVEPKVCAYRSLDTENAVAQARKLQAQIDKEGYPSDQPFFGIPVALKDNMCSVGQLTSCSSKILENFKPPYDATVVSKLKAQNAVLIGKTNMDEFAMGSSTENSAFVKTCNPYDLNCVPGGSSGGSAAAVAADQAFASLGSDTGGSIRQPASFCGVVGMKPTYGRVSRYGLVAFASSLDQIGPFSKSVEDAALFLEAISGADPHDNTSVDMPVPSYSEEMKKPVKGMKIAVPKEYFAQGIDPEVKAIVENSIKELEAMGAVCEEVSLPHTKYCVSTYYLIATAEASSNLARFDGVHYGYRADGAKNIVDLFSKTRAEGFGDEVKRRIMLGTYVLSAGYFDAYYLKALRVRTLIKQDFENVFKDYQAIITPTSPSPAFQFGAKTADPLEMYLSDICTISVNLAGTNGLSMNAGFTKSGLPVGVQLIAKPFDESTLFQVAWNLEQALDLNCKPNL